MSDGEGKTGWPDRGRIGGNSGWEGEEWTRALGVSEQQLRDAVDQVGTSADAVRRHLGK